MMRVDPEGPCVEDACIGEGELFCLEFPQLCEDAAAAVWDGCEWIISQMAGGREKTPNTGVPGSTHVNPSNGQKRKYGDDGKPIKDIDSNHDHGAGNPHVHDWGRDPNGNPIRGPARPPKPGELE